MDKYLAPEPIGEGDLHSQWKRFSREFSQFLVAVGKRESEPTKLAIFLRLVGPRGNDLYETMRFEEGEDKTKWSVVSASLVPRPSMKKDGLVAIATMLVRMRWPLPEKHVIVYLACKPFRKLTHIRSASLRFCL